MFSTSEERIEEEEARLGRRLPEDLRRRVLEENGGEIEVLGEFASDEQDDNVWQLIGVADVIERKGRKRPVEGMAQQTEEARDFRELPEGSVAIAHDGSGNDLLLMPDDSYAVYWLDGAELDPATVRWRVRDL